MWNKIRQINVLYMVIAILCAVLVWFYVDLTVEPEVKKTIHDIPVEFVGDDVLEKEGLMVSDGENTTLSLTFSGTRAVVSQLKRANIKVTADLSEQITEAGVQSVEYNVNYPSNVRLSSSRSIREIELTVVKMNTKTVSVEGVFEGSVADGYLSDESKFQFDTSFITVGGEESQVAQIDHAEAVLAEQNLTDTWSGTLSLILVDKNGEELDQTGLTLSQTEVETTFPVSMVKTIPLKVSLTEGGGATAEDVSCTVTPSTIQVSGTAEDLEGLEELNLGTVDLAQVVTTLRSSFDITLPDGVTCSSGEKTASVDVTIKSSLTTRRVNASRLSVKNAPEGYTVSLADDSVEVRIRGPRDSMSLLEAGDVVLNVDLKDVNIDEANEFTVPVEVSVTGMSDVGAVGSYEATVQLSIDTGEE